MIKVKCHWCRKDYFVIPSRVKITKCCSAFCRQKYVGKIVQIKLRKSTFEKCLCCGKKILVKPCHKKKGYGKYCSCKCKGLDSRGKRMSPETEFKKGIHPPTEFKKGNLKPKNAFKWESGEKHWNWQGGITPFYWKLKNSIKSELNKWRKEVFKRDNYTCQKTGIRGGKIHPHHIRNFIDYPKLRIDLDNGITLSEKAHREFHKIYGKKDNTQEQLEEFFKATQPLAGI